MCGEPQLQLQLLRCWSLAREGISFSINFREQRLLAALAIHGQRPRSYYSGLLWPECSELRAKGSLRAAVFNVLRHAPEALECDGRNIRLGRRVQVDLHELQKLLTGVDEGNRPLSAWIDNPNNIELLPGWCDDWVISTREQLLNQFIILAESAAENAIVSQDYIFALRVAQTLCGIDRYRESSALLLMQSHLAMGNRARALHAFRQHAAALGELGACPSPEIISLFSSKGLPQH